MSEKICKNCKNWKKYTNSAYGICEIVKGGDFVRANDDGCEEFERKENDHEWHKSSEYDN